MGMEQAAGLRQHWSPWSAKGNRWLRSVDKPTGLDWREKRREETEKEEMKGVEAEVEVARADPSDSLQVREG